jgi:hypothetical protein
MTVSPEYSEEERMRQQSQGRRPPGRADLGEREIQEHDRAERDLEHLEPDDNEAHAPGQVCARCGAVISGSDDVRRLPNSRWMHEVCPPDLGGRPAAGTRPEGGG